MSKSSSDRYWARKRAQWQRDRPYQDSSDYDEILKAREREDAAVEAVRERSRREINGQSVSPGRAGLPGHGKKR
jgi:hypothetical protein